MRVEGEKPEWFYRLPLQVRIVVPDYPGWEEDQKDWREAERLGISVVEYRRGSLFTPEEQEKIKRDRELGRPDFDPYDYDHRGY